jgi:hypothetical protein
MLLADGKISSRKSRRRIHRGYCSINAERLLKKQRLWKQPLHGSRYVQSRKVLTAIQQARPERPKRRRQPHKTGLGPPSSSGAALFEAITRLAAGDCQLPPRTTTTTHCQKSETIHSWILPQRNTTQESLRGRLLVRSKSLRTWIKLETT